ncbi:MAG: AAA family ATPase, partial [Candidatus Omnitrophota bacterium]
MPAIHEIPQRLIDNISKVIVGKRGVIELVVVGLMSKGHVLLEDVPGLGKTMLSRSLAKSIQGNFKRIQFTPDLLPSDVTGVSIYNQKKGEFEFREGPVFANILLADEINRTTPRTQSALLEAMQEFKVTIDGTLRELPDPFFV